MHGGWQLQPFRRRGQPSPVSVSALNRLVSVLNSFLRLRIARGERDEVVFSDHGVVLQLAEDRAGDITSTGLGEWRWAANKEYSSATTYAEDEIVQVSPGNPAVSDTCPAGLYISLVAGNTAAPQWPPPNSDPNSAINKWWLISLYATPVELSSCVTGKTYIVAAHEKPEAPE